MNGIETIQNLPSKIQTEMKKMCRKSAEVFGKDNTNAIMELVYQDLDKRLGYIRNEKRK